MSDQDDVTLAVLGSLVRRLSDQIDRMADTLQHMETDNRTRFDNLALVYVPREIHTADIKAFNERQDFYQKQTDQMLLGFGNEMQKVHHDITDAEARRVADHDAALQEIQAVEDRRVAALEKVAEQRHSDRMQQGGWILTALLFPIIVGVVVAFATGAFT